MLNYPTATSLSWVLCWTTLQQPHYPEFCAELSYRHFITCNSVLNYLTATSLPAFLYWIILPPLHYLQFCTELSYSQFTYMQFCAELSYRHFTTCISVLNHLTATSLPAVLYWTILPPIHYLQFCAELSYRYVTTCSSVLNCLTATSLPAVPYWTILPPIHYLQFSAELSYRHFTTCNSFISHHSNLQRTVCTFQHISRPVAKVGHSADSGVSVPWLATSAYGVLLSLNNNNI